MNESNLGYSQALFELAKESNKLDLFLKDSKTLLAAVDENPNFIAMYTTTQVTKEDKKKSLQDLLSSQLDKNFLTGLMLMIDQGNFYNLDKTLEKLISLIHLELGIKEGIVYSAKKLNEETLAKVVKALSERTNSKVELRNQTDANLIGGIKVVLENKVYDNSIDTQLKKLQSEMMKGHN